MGVPRFSAIAAIWTAFWVPSAPLLASGGGGELDHAIWVGAVYTNTNVSVTATEGPAPKNAWTVTVSAPVDSNTGRRLGRPYWVRVYDERPTLRQIRAFRGDEVPLYTLDLSPSGVPALFTLYEDGVRAKVLRFNGSGQVQERIDGDGAETVTTAVVFDEDGRPIRRVVTEAGNPPRVRQILLDWQGYEIVRERTFDGDGRLLETLSRTVGSNRTVETKRGPEGEVVEETRITYDGKGRAIFAEKKGEGNISWAYDQGDLPSRAAMWDALGHLEKETQFLWKKKVEPVDLFGGGWIADIHETFGVKGLEGLRDRLRLVHESGRLIEGRESRFWKGAVTVRRQTVGGGTLVLTQDGMGHEQERQVLGVDGSMQGSLTWQWKSGRPHSVTVRGPGGRVERSLSFLYQGSNKATLTNLSREGLDPFFTGGDGFVAWADRGLTEAGDRSERQEASLRSAVASMERLGMAGFLERDGKGELTRIRTFAVTNGRHARLATFTEYGRLREDDLRQSALMALRTRASGMKGEETQDLAVLLKARFEAFAAAGCPEGDEAKAFYRGRVTVVLGAPGPAVATVQAWGPRGETTVLSTSTREGKNTVVLPDTADLLWEDYTRRRAQPGAKTADPVPGKTPAHEGHP